jgi:hypothetical protein
MKLHRLLIIALGILCVTTESFSSDPASYGLEIFISDLPPYYVPVKNFPSKSIGTRDSTVSINNCRLND